MPIETTKSAKVDEIPNVCHQCVHAKKKENGTIYCDKYEHENSGVKRKIHDVRSKPPWCPLEG